MQRTIEIQYRNSLSVFSMTKLDRSTLYGSKRRIPIDSHGEACKTACLTADGRYILPTGGKALLYLDDKNNTVKRRDLVAVGGDGKKVQPEKSTLDSPHLLSALQSPDSILDCSITHVYVLEPASLPNEMETDFPENGIFKIPFRYSSGNQPLDSFLVKNDADFFILTGQCNDFDFVGLEEADQSLPDSEDEEWELDFAMA